MHRVDTQGGNNATERKARILQIGNFPPPICGWAVHTQAIHEALISDGVDSQVLDLGPSRRVSGRRCIPVFSGFDYFAKLIGSRLHGYTFEVHINGDTWKRYLLALMAVLLGRITRKPAILMFHAGPKQLYFPRKGGFWFFAFKLLFHTSGEIICNLDSVKQQIVQYGILPGKIHPIFSVEYPLEAIPVPLSSSVEHFLQQHEPRLFSYSLFRPEFTMDRLFKAFAEVRRHFLRAGLLIVGPQETPAEAQQQLRALGIEADVLIAGNLPRAEFLTAIKRSDIFIRTHLRDGLCSSVLEALNLGVPVVAAEDGIRPPSVVTYAPSQTEALTRTLLQVLRNLSSVRAQLEIPNLPTSLQGEISLLISVASRSTR